MKIRTVIYGFLLLFCNAAMSIEAIIPVMDGTGYLWKIDDLQEPIATYRESCYLTAGLIKRVSCYRPYFNLSKNIFENGSTLTIIDFNNYKITTDNALLGLMTGSLIDEGVRDVIDDAVAKGSPITISTTYKTMFNRPSISLMFGDEFLSSEVLSENKAAPIYERYTLKSFFILSTKELKPSRELEKAHRELLEYYVLVSLMFLFVSAVVYFIVIFIKRNMQRIYKSRDRIIHLVELKRIQKISKDEIIRIHTRMHFDNIEASKNMRINASSDGGDSSKDGADS